MEKAWLRHSLYKILSGNGWSPSALSATASSHLRRRLPQAQPVITTPFHLGKGWYLFLHQATSYEKLLKKAAAAGIHCGWPANNLVNKILDH
jgi:hypothetical protein